MRIEDVGKWRHSRQKYTLSDAGRQLMLNTYDGTSASVTILSQRLSVPRDTVIRWAQQLGIARTMDRRWTQEELQFLERNAHKMSARRIAEKLGRTPTSVQKRMYRMGINHISEGYTQKALAEGLGITDEARILRWIKDGWLKATRRNTEKVHGTDPYYISEKAIRDFISKHYEILDTCNPYWTWLGSVLFDSGELGKGEKR